MKRLPKGQTRLNVEGVELGDFISKNFSSLTERFVELTSKSVLSAVIQEYLDTNKHRIRENRLRGIMAFQDPYINSTGGRVHLVVGVSGPLADSFGPEVIIEPADYEDKSKYFIKAIESTSEEKCPWIGNIHVHVYRCGNTQAKPKELVDLIRIEHCIQNNLQQTADYKPYVFVYSPDGQSHWRYATIDVMNNLFSNKTVRN